MELLERITACIRRYPGGITGVLSALLVISGIVVAVERQRVARCESRCAEIKTNCEREISLLTRKYESDLERAKLEAQIERLNARMDRNERDSILQETTRWLEREAELSENEKTRDAILELIANLRPPSCNECILECSRKHPDLGLDYFKCLRRCRCNDRP
jgi:hypothetical protein